MFATRFQILRQKCTIFDYGWASRQTPLGSLHRSLIPLARFKGILLRGRVEKGRRGG